VRMGAVAPRAHELRQREMSPPSSRSV
jgi:hypothetical protein